MTSPSPSPRWMPRLSFLAAHKWPCLAILAGLLLMIWMLRFWHPVYGFTPLLQLDASNDELKLAALREYPVYVYRDTGGYDGLYYAQIATAPSLTDPALPAAMDNLSYRARRILGPALAWSLGMGRPEWILPLYAGLNLAVWLAFAFLLWRALAVQDARAWFAWAGLVFSAGALGSLRLALSDLLALTLLLAALLAVEKSRSKSALLWLALAALARETSIIGTLGLREKFPQKTREIFNWSLAVLLVAAPLVLWLAYVRWRVGPADQGWGNFSWPLSAWWNKGAEALFALQDPRFRLLACGTLLAYIGISVQMLFIVTRWQPQNPWWRLGLAYSAMAALLGTAVWEGHPGAATRVLLPLHLACCIIMVRSRASIAWLTAANLGVLAGLLCLARPPALPQELTALRQGSESTILSIDQGWYGIEHGQGKRWTWTAKQGDLLIEAWPKSQTHRIRVKLRLRALQPREVRVLSEGREVARLQVGIKASSFSLPEIKVHDGRAKLMLSCEAEPIAPEGAPKGSLPLGFCLQDPELEIVSSEGR